ncbi:glycosyltransferase [Patescibacteria group bacterium]
MKKIVLGPPSMISIILPLAKNESKRKIKRCLNSLTRQTCQDFELIIVSFPSVLKKFSHLFQKYHFIKKVLAGSWNKSAARNIGAKKAKGKYLFFIDADHFFEPFVLAKATKLIRSKKAKVVILPERVRPTNFITRIRCLERKFNFYDPCLAVPRIIKAVLFKKIGGFDEKVSMLDDWTIYFRLKRKKVKFFRLSLFLYVDDPLTIKETVSNKYARGQYIPLLKKNYPEFNQIAHPQRLMVYLKHYQLFFDDPLASFGLIFLKLFDWLLLTLGSLNPITTNLYEKKEVAKDYDKIRSATNFQLFKNFTEEQALKILLKPAPKNILEIGAGTGRITYFLTKMNFQVLPTEPSKAMLHQFLKKVGLPRPTQISAENLSLGLGKFDCVLGIRVIWHLKDCKKHQKILQNASLLSKKWVIFDFANGQKYKNPILYPFFRLYGLFFNPRFYRNKYFFTLEEIKKLAKKSKLTVDKILPLDLLTPLWLNLLPKKLAKRFFPSLFKLELKLAKIIPSGRWLVKFKIA